MRLSIVILSILSITFGAIGNSYLIERTGRRIQLDGFLLEWDNELAGELQNTPAVRWDMLKTAEGLTGYFRETEDDSTALQLVQVRINTGEGNGLLVFEDTSRVSAEPLAVWQQDAGLATVEFVLPWNMVLTETDDFGVSFAIQGDDSTFSDTLNVSGTFEGKQGFSAVITPGIMLQVALILMLGIAYIFMYLRIIRKNRQKESLHQ